MEIDNVGPPNWWAGAAEYVANHHGDVRFRMAQGRHAYRAWSHEREMKRLEKVDQRKNRMEIEPLRSSGIGLPQVHVSKSRSGRSSGRQISVKIRRVDA